ncbi:O-antigen/teichoic acid export membrane protein [Paenarthrobacter nitroguajacolicus]|uniref:oligosaccharide flippase family protein n=1 Tax=Paenarthrobacter nitroguajacolicus TaxID=211146 RepID=UPI00285F88D4|nr:oligosaccharide flippase family protein [Paenarthrobacter nitroguajacolicus]MDR6987269.1 O-antigen/teichoic acid export membrane protein [Paenarthrobacter nitroguajacolicus]
MTTLNGQDPTLGNRAASATLWGGVNMALGRVVQFATTIIVARLMAPEHFGALAVAIVVQTVATNMAELGATASLARGTGDPDKIAPTVFSIALVTSGIMTASAIVLAPSLAAAFDDPAATPVIQVLSITILLQGIGAVPSTMVWREFLQKPRVVVDLCSLVTVLVLVVPMALDGWGAMALAWSRVGGQLVAMAGYWMITPKRYAPGFDRVAAVEILRLGMPLAMANLVVFVTLNVDYLLIGRMLDPTALGLYLLAFNLAGLPSSVITAVIRATAVPTFGRLYSEGTLGALASKFVTGVSYCAFPISAMVTALAHPLIVTAYGGAWAPAGIALATLGVFGATRILVELFADLSVGAGRTGWLFWVQVAWLATLTPALFLGITWWGIAGAGIAHAAVACLVVIPVYVTSLTSVLHTSAWKLLRGSIRPLVAASLAGAAAWLATQGMANPAMALAAGTLVGSVLYVLLTFRQGQQLVAEVRGLLRVKAGTPGPSIAGRPESAGQR